MVKSWNSMKKNAGELGLKFFLRWILLFLIIELTILLRIFCSCSSANLL
jgi:hypothetical protein